MTWKIPQIQKAFEHGQDIGASHMIVAYDSFDHENYAIYVQPGQDPKKLFPDNGDRVDEVYSYALTWDEQSREGRVYHTEFQEPLTLHVASLEDWQKYAGSLEQMLLNVGIRPGMIESIRREKLHG